MYNKQNNTQHGLGLGLQCLTPLSTIFQNTQHEMYPLKKINNLIIS